MIDTPPKPGRLGEKPRPSILVADDEKQVRELLDIHLSGLGYQMATARDGREALELFKKRHFDLIISDVRMPGLDGLQLMRAARAINPRVLVILISGYGDMETVVKALKSGAENFLPKPLKLITLSKVVGQALGLRCLPPSTDGPLPCVRQATEIDCPSSSKMLTETVYQIALSAVAVGFAQRDLDTNLKLAVSEALTNAMEHGNNWDPGKRVKVEVELSREMLQIAIEDEGPGFDFAALPDPTDRLNLTQERGRGVFLIQTIMDEIVFEGSGNRIIMRKYNKPADDTGRDSD